MTETKQKSISVGIAHVIVFLLMTALCALCLVACGNSEIEREGLAAPENLRIVDEVLMWDEVEDAKGYIVEIDGVSFETEISELNVLLITTMPKTYVMRVRANGNADEKNDFAWSKPFEYSADVQVNGWEFCLINNDTEYEISKVSKEHMSGKVIIPEKHADGRFITRLSSAAFKNCTELTSVIMPDCIKVIGSEAFKGCVNLATLRMPKNLIAINDMAFSGCESLKNVEFPTDLQTIGAYAFNNCNGLTEAIVPGSVETVELSAFTTCASLKKVVIDSGVKVLMSAIVNCEALEEVVISDTVSSIGQGIFSGCNSLNKITVDENNTVYKSEGNCVIQRADNKLVAGCMASEIPDYVESIGIGAFENRAITHVTVKTNNCDEKEDGVMELPSGLKRIESNAFACCKMLRTVQLPDDLIELSEGAFNYCGNLDMVITNSVDMSIKNYYDVNLFECANVFTSLSCYPDGWHRDGDRSRSLVFDWGAVRNCTFGEDNGRLFVDSFVYDGDRKGMSNTIKNPYRKGYDFVGWSTNSRDGDMLELKKFISPNKAVSYYYLDSGCLNDFPANTVIYAVWKPIE